MNYIEPLTEAGERAAAILVSPEGGAVMYRAQPCLVIYGIPAWIMPNGMVRVGEPDAPMLSPDHAARTLREIASERAPTAEPHDPIPDRGPPNLAGDAYEAWRQR